MLIRKGNSTPRRCVILEPVQALDKKLVVIEVEAPFSPPYVNIPNLDILELGIEDILSVDFDLVKEPPQRSSQYPLNIGDRIETIYEGKLLQGTVVTAYAGSYGVVVDEKFHDGPYHKGHGLTIDKWAAYDDLVRFKSERIRRIISEDEETTSLPPSRLRRSVVLDNQI